MNRISRREIRRKLGSRTERRRGTKSKTIPGPNQEHTQKYTLPRRPRRPSVKVEAKIRQLMREGAAPEA